MDSRSITRRSIEQLNGVSEGEVRVRRAERSDGRQTRLTIKANSFIDQDGGGSRGLQEREIASVCKERELSGARMLDSGDALDVSLGITLEAASQFLCNFRKF